jgi:hypothetical protein
MSLGARVVDALKKGATGAVEAEEGGVRARVDVVGSGPYGADVRGISVERSGASGAGGAGGAGGAKDPDRARRTGEAVRAIERRVDYLPERVKAHEVEPAQGRGVLRTEPRQVRDREYYEVEVDGGERVDVHRYRWEPGRSGREQVPENFGHKILRRLVDDLGGIVGPGPESDD